MNQLQNDVTNMALIIEFTIQAVFWLLMVHVVHHWNDNKK